MSNDESSLVDIQDSAEYGAILVCKDRELADELDDFLTEHCFVFFTRTFSSDSTSMYFGQAASVERVTALYRRFVDAPE